MTRSFIAAFLLSACLCSSTAAQPVDELRIICKEEKAQDAIRKRLKGVDLELFEVELKFSCPRLDLSSKPVHDSADTSREASHTDWVYDARYSADGRTIVSAGKDGSLGVWDTATGRLIGRIVMPEAVPPSERSGVSYVRSAAFVGDGTVIAAAKDGYPVLLYDAATGVQTGELPLVPTVYRMRMAAARNGLLLLGGDQDEVLAIDMATRTMRHRLPGHKPAARSVAVSDTADLVATAPDPADRGERNTTNRVFLWRLSTGEKLAELTFRDSSAAYSLAFSRDGTQLAAFADGTVYIFSVKDRSVTRTIVVHPFAGNDIAFTADGKGLITCRSHLVLWDLASGDIVRHFGPFHDGCHSVDISPDGRFAVSTSMASDVQIWEIATGVFHRRLGIDVQPPR